MCLNSGTVALVAVAVAMALPAVLSLGGSAEVINMPILEKGAEAAVIVGLIINSFLNKDACDLEEE